MGSASPVWFSYQDYNLLASAGKEAVVYLLDAADLGSKDHQTPLYTVHLANDTKEFQAKGVWGPVSKDAPNFPISNGPVPHGCVMAFKVARDSSSHKPILKPEWISGDFN